MHHEARQRKKHRHIIIGVRMTHIFGHTVLACMFDKGYRKGALTELCACFLLSPMLLHVCVVEHLGSNANLASTHTSFLMVQGGEGCFSLLFLAFCVLLDAL